MEVRSNGLLINQRGAISRKFEDGNQYEKVALYAPRGWRKKPWAIDDFPFAANICGQLDSGST